MKARRERKQEKDYNKITFFPVPILRMFNRVLTE